MVFGVTRAHSDSKGLDDIVEITCQKSALVLQDIVQRLSVMIWKKGLVLLDTEN